VGYLTYFYDMRYKRIYIDLERLQAFIKMRGLRDRDFCVIMWGADTHRTVMEYTKHPNTRIDTAMKICNTLDISLDELFSGSDINGESPYQIGNKEKGESSEANQDPRTLMVENNALKMLLKEKDARIADLKKVNERLMEMLFQNGTEVGQ